MDLIYYGVFHPMYYINACKNNYPSYDIYGIRNLIFVYRNYIMSKKQTKETNNFSYTMGLCSFFIELLNNF